MYMLDRDRLHMCITWSTMVKTIKQINNKNNSADNTSSPSQTDSHADTSRELSVYLQICLARPCVHLCWLAMTCAHFDQDQICIDTKFSRFGHPTHSLLYQPTCISQWNKDMSALKWVFWRLVWTCKETCESVWPSSTKVYANSTCGYLRARLARALKSFYHMKTEVHVGMLYLKSRISSLRCASFCLLVWLDNCFKEF